MSAASSSSFLNAIYDMEETFSQKMTDRCSAFGGRKLIDQLLASKLSHISNGTSQIFSYHHNEYADIYLAHNVSVVVKLNATKKEKNLEMRMQVDGHITDQQARLKPEGGNVLNGLTHSIESGNLDHCDSYIAHPIMLVDENFSGANWWFFMKDLLTSFIEFTVVQPQVSSVYGNDDVQVLHTSEGRNQWRPFTDAYEFLFSNHRGMDSVQLQELVAASSSSGNQVTLCLRHVFWSPDRGKHILINRRHSFDNCFSSIVAAFAAHLKAAVHIPTLPTPPKPRVVWVARDPSQKANPTSWQKNRIISNQPELIAYLKQQCYAMGIELIVADFYGDKIHTSFEEQAHFVSRTNIMMGIHGAGLNMFMFLPSNSVVVEVHIGATTAQKNSANTVTHMGVGKYLRVMGRTDSESKMPLLPVWDKLKQAIDVWYELNGVSHVAK